jgi:hypothetical protein
MKNGLWIVMHTAKIARFLLVEEIESISCCLLLLPAPSEVYLSLV